MYGAHLLSLFSTRILASNTRHAIAPAQDPELNKLKINFEKDKITAINRVH